mgnify:CR=1 FL=1
MYEPEVGQSLFGNPWGEYEASVQVEAFLDYILAEIKRVYWNVNQQEWDEYEAPKILGIEYRPYYWGECTCGWDTFEKEKLDKRKADNKHKQDCFRSGDNIKPSGFYQECIKEFGGDACYGHKSTCASVLPNFKFEDVEIRWYKHPGRGMSVNKNMSDTEWAEWLNRCIATIRKADIEIE